METRVEDPEVLARAALGETEPDTAGALETGAIPAELEQRIAEIRKSLLGEIPYPTDPRVQLAIETLRIGAQAHVNLTGRCRDACCEVITAAILQRAINPANVDGEWERPHSKPIVAERPEHYGTVA